MATEFDKSMNTMFGSYSRTKERKKANRRSWASEKANLVRVGGLFRFVALMQLNEVRPARPGFRPVRQVVVVAAVRSGDS